MQITLRSTWYLHSSVCTPLLTQNYNEPTKSTTTSLPGMMYSSALGTRSRVFNLPFSFRCCCRYLSSFSVEEAAKGTELLLGESGRLPTSLMVLKCWRTCLNLV